MRLVILFLLSLPCSLILRAQDTGRPTTAAQDSARVHRLVARAGELLLDRPDSSELLCQQALVLAQRAGYPKDIAEVEGWLAYLAEQRGDIASAILHYEHSLTVFRQLHNKQQEAIVLNNLGAIYKDQGHLEEALAAHRNSLAIRSELGDSSGIATSLNNIGLIAYDQGKIPDAMEHYTEALRLYEKLNDNEGIATALHNIAGIYRDQGDRKEALAHFESALAAQEALHNAYGMASTEDNIGGVLQEDGRTEEALRHYQRALALHDTVGDARGMGYSLRNIAGIELEMGEVDAALQHARQSLAQFEASDDKRGRATALTMMGTAQERAGRTAMAIELGEQALTLARELGYPQQLRDAAGLLGRIYRTRHLWQPALEMNDLYIRMRDSVVNEDARRSSIREQYRYAYEKKEVEMRAEQVKRDAIAREQLQQEKNRRNLGLAGGGGVLLLAIGLWTRLRHTRRSRAAIQKEKDISEGLLLNILPAEVAEELKRKGHADARLFERATVLFTDFKGFTGIAEQLSPADLVAEINTCFEAFDHLMGVHRVEKIKTIGDAYMAVGGLPDPDIGEPVDVVRAALAMQAFMIDRARVREAEGKPAFHMRVGIHSGPVVAGIVGVRKFQYDIWGDAVNTASRMESSGEIGKVNISESTYALVKNEAGLTFTSRGKVQAKGKGEMEMYFVMGTLGIVAEQVEIRVLRTE
ncbi:MAG: adenylate/guanylate cyclase domain-containing protein [Flavobacteriales bacterium]